MEERHVVTCFMEYGGKILLLRRSQNVGTYKGTWAGVSGYIEADNSPFQQAVVEIGEELGLMEEDFELVMEGDTVEAVDEQLERKWIIHPYRFLLSESEKVKIDWEHTELKWIDPRDISHYKTVPKLSEVWKRIAKE